jgi:RNA recognition motif-containing protein
MHFSDDLKPDSRERSPSHQSIILQSIMNNKLFVGNLSFDVTENDLKDLFAQHGSVVEVNLVLDRATGRSRGFAFVTLATDEAAQAAIQALSGYSLQGRALTVNVARVREERPGGGQGGDPGGGRGGGDHGPRGGGYRQRY